MSFLLTAEIALEATEKRHTIKRYALLTYGKCS
jgi:hypothetical protein